MMDNLKTLSEIESEMTSVHCMDCGCFSQMQDKLREEAIKWVKALKGKDLIDKNCPRCLESGTRIFGMLCNAPLVFDDDQALATCDFLRFFFNLTEEDFKND